jgi:AAA family ATP:ADP antiporter
MASLSKSKQDEIDEKAAPVRAVDSIKIHKSHLDKSLRAEIDPNTKEEILPEKNWSKMNTSVSFTSSATEFMDRAMRKITGDLDGDDFLRVLWLGGTLFFIVGGYWLLRTIKDPIISSIDGVQYIPQAKIASLFVVFGLVVVYNKMLDIYPKSQVFYMMGLFYGLLFFAIGILLLHPTIGLPNTTADPSRLLGWVSYVAIESFGSMVVQCFWALVNSSVNVNFAKKNFGFIVAGAQIGSVLGPSLATQADTIGVPGLYIFASGIMFCMVGAMYYYIEKFGSLNEEAEIDDKSRLKSSSGKEEGVMEGFYLFYNHDFVKGIFAGNNLIEKLMYTIDDYYCKLFVVQFQVST